MVLTFKQQRSETTKIEEANPTRVVLQKFPFLDKELPVSSNIVVHKYSLLIKKNDGGCLQLSGNVKNMGLLFIGYYCQGWWGVF